jgi:hypothetical protein
MEATMKSPINSQPVRRAAGPIRRVDSPRHATAGQFIAHAQRRGYRVLTQGSWPNSAAWYGLAKAGSDEVDVMVRHYRDQTFTVQSCDGNGSVAHLLDDDAEA